MRLRQVSILILLLYAGLTVYNVFSIYFGIAFQPFFTPLLTILAFIFALLHGIQHLGWQKTLLLLGLTFGVSLFFESVGVATGWVYGPYHYTDKLGPKFLDLVPFLIPVAWFMTSYPSYIIGSLVTAKLLPVRDDTTLPSWVWRLAAAAVGALVMTAWDLAMDPMMVAGGHWVWDVQGAYFGIPLQNYWGWWLTVFVAFALYGFLGKPEPISVTSPRRNERLAIVSYAITGMSCVLIDLQIGLGGPALTGFFGMLPWIFLGW